MKFHFFAYIHLQEQEIQDLLALSLLAAEVELDIDS